MLNGLDFLFVVIGLVLLLIVWIFSAKYIEWEDEQAWKRRQRERDRYEMGLVFEEMEYRISLRLFGAMSRMSKHLISVGVVTSDVTRSLNNLDETMKNFRKKFGYVTADQLREDLSKGV